MPALSPIRPLLGLPDPSLLMALGESSLLGSQKKGGEKSQRRFPPLKPGRPLPLTSEPPPNQNVKIPRKQ